MINFLFTKTPLAAITQSLWRDEAFSYLLAKRNIFEMFLLTARDFNPPLYYLLLHFWMQLFGSSEIAMRSLSFIFYWATIYLAYLFITEILQINAKKAFYYLLFFIFNPLLLRYAFEARMYSQFAFFTLLSFYAFYSKKPKLYILATTLGLLTHYFMIFVLISQGVYLLIQKNKSKVLSTLKLMVLCLVPFSAWMIYVFSIHSSSDISSWIKPTILKNIFYIPGVLYTGFELDYSTFDGIVGKSYPPQLLVFLAGIIFLVTALFNKLKSSSKKFDQLKLLLLWTFLGPIMLFLISFFIPVFWPRYVIFATVGLLMLMVFLTDNFSNKLKTPILVILLIIHLLFSIKTLMYFHPKEDLRTPILEIKKLAHKDDLLYVTNDAEFFMAQYYFDEDRVFIYGKSYEDVPYYIGKIIVPKQKIATTLPNYPQKAFILKSDHTYDIQAAF